MDKGGISMSSSELSSSASVYALEDACVPCEKTLDRLSLDAWLCFFSIDGSVPAMSGSEMLLVSFATSAPPLEGRGLLDWWDWQRPGGAGWKGGAAAGDSWAWSLLGAMG